MNDTIKLTLASQSPRRAALLRQMGFVFDVVPPDMDESGVSSADPVAHVMGLSRRKAEAVLDRVGGGLVIGADTVVCIEGAILGKPADPAEARSMLRRLSGKTHTVTTGFMLIESESMKSLGDFEQTDVTFRRLESWEIEAYASSGHPLDKAGAYGIQDQSGLFVERIDGCFYNVVGFPLTKFYEALKRFGYADALEAVLRGNHSNG
jgi:septum formation protein